MPNHVASRKPDGKERAPATAFAVAEEVRALIGERQQGARLRRRVTCPSPASQFDVANLGKAGAVLVQ